MTDRFGDVKLENYPVVMNKPGYSVCYFTGPLFYRDHMVEFDEFWDSVETPMDVLRDDRRREKLVQVVSNFKEQKDLFGTEEDVERLFEGVLEQTSLYSRFMQGKRLVYNPLKSFDELARQYLQPFVRKEKAHSSCHGWERGKSVEASLHAHLPIGSALTFDMKSATDQCEITDVFGFYYRGLEQYDDDQRRDAAGFLSALSTVRLDLEDGGGLSVLPQGSPLSGLIFNRVMYPVDKRLDEVCSERGMRYTRWGDDFTISSPDSLGFGAFADALHIAQENFSLAPDKVFFMQGKVYALGHRLERDKIVKIDPDVLETERGLPLTGSQLEDTHPRGLHIYTLPDDGGAESFIDHGLIEYDEHHYEPTRRDWEFLREQNFASSDDKIYEDLPEEVYIPEPDEWKFLREQDWGKHELNGDWWRYTDAESYFFNSIAASIALSESDFDEPSPRDLEDYLTGNYN